MFWYTKFQKSPYRHPPPVIPMQECRLLYKVLKMPYCQLHLRNRDEISTPLQQPQKLDQTQTISPGYRTFLFWPLF